MKYITIAVARGASIASYYKKLEIILLRILEGCKSNDLMLRIVSFNQTVREEIPFQKPNFFTPSRIFGILKDASGTIAPLDCFLDCIKHINKACKEKRHDAVMIMILDEDGRSKADLKDCQEALRIAKYASNFKSIMVAVNIKDTDDGFEMIELKYNLGFEEYFEISGSSDDEFEIIQKYLIDFIN